MDKTRVAFVIISAVIIGASFWYAYGVASSPGLKCYIGDEVWYIPASRNVLHMLGFQLTYIDNGSRGVNVIFTNESYKLEYQSTVDYYATLEGATMSRDYSQFPAVYYEIPRGNFSRFLGDLKLALPSNTYYTVPGFWYPDKENIQNYINTEHPFLGKDFIMASMVLLGDEPINWRLPGLILFAVVQILVLLATYRITRSYLASLIALIFTAADPTLQATAVAAMLDIYVAFGVALFVAALTFRSRWPAAVSIGLAGATKFSGAFGWPVLVYRAMKEEKSLKKFVATIIVVPLVSFLIPNFTIIAAIGFVPWLKQILGSFRWHLSYKGPNPNTSPFWQWFINYRPFPFHFNPTIYADTDPVLLLAMVIFVFAMPWLYRRKKEILLPFLVFWSTVGFFALQYLLGGTTQFSFYATALVPPAAVTMGAALNELMRWEAFRESLAFYWDWIVGIKRRVGR